MGLIISRYIENNNSNYTLPIYQSDCIYMSLFESDNSKLTDYHLLSTLI